MKLNGDLDCQVLESAIKAFHMSLSALEALQ